ncbi:hypothetical protein LRS13_25250 [Svornostia abyssi]|uniref:Small secreted protein n=1 Tax=Svornostia abyssi TaxID=2898438 RepID=A0ABY5PGV2_9ACTN|nr:hypothetical protein LRS13_25250 [Parviterribacteraceae bacterium J379]
MSLCRPIALTLTCAVVLAACGGGDDDALSAEDYRAKGNAACEQYEKDVRAISQPQSIQQVADYAGKAKVELDQLIDELDALQPPSDLEEQHDELVKLGRESVEALGGLAEAGKTGDQEQIQQALSGAAELDTQSDKVAGELGLDKCADQS